MEFKHVALSNTVVVLQPQFKIHDLEHKTLKDKSRVERPPKMLHMLQKSGTKPSKISFAHARHRVTQKSRAYLKRVTQAQLKQIIELNRLVLLRHKLSLNLSGC